MVLRRASSLIECRWQGAALGALVLVVSFLESEARCAEAVIKAKVSLGQELFAREWVANDPRCHGGDGLGPVYNDTSCIGCHNQGGPGGAGPVSKNVELVTLFRTYEPKDLDGLHPGFRKASSLVLHQFGTDPEYRVWRLRHVEGVEYAELANARGESEIEQIKAVLKGQEGSRPLVRGRMLFNEVATLTRRSPPPLFGAGLIDSISRDILLETAAKEYRETPEVKGRLNELPGGLVGRFGWKAQVASLDDFVLSACANELGLQTPGHLQAESPLDDAPKPKGLDMTRDECDALVAYVSHLPSPIQRGSSGGEEFPFVTRGRALFAKVGCADCHKPNLGPVQGIYSDLLLHDMGEDLADGGSYYGVSDRDPTATRVSPAQWRTPPLWGFRDSGPYLHDGRANTLDQAVALHDGQGKKSAKQFFELAPQDRQLILSFLNTLTAPAADRSP